MNNKREKRKNILLQLVIGVVAGVMIVFPMVRLRHSLLAVLFLYLGLFIFYFLHMILHEAGHLVSGLLTEYQFVSFRVGNLTLVKRGGRFLWKRYKIPGTGGQCLMASPGEDEINYPYVLYNLGGVLSNLFFGMIGLLIFVTANNELVSALSWSFFFTAFFIGALNGIPMKLGGIGNDGYNILAMKKDPEARRAFFRMLKINQNMTEGISITEMPLEWFSFSEESIEKNHLVAGMTTYLLDYYMAKMDFVSAKALADKMILGDSGLLELHTQEFKRERLFMELVGAGDLRVISSLCTPELRKAMYAARDIPHNCRTLYACALLLDKNMALAEKCRDELHKMAPSYVYPSVIETEREFMRLVDEKTRERI